MENSFLPAGVPLSKRAKRGQTLFDHSSYSETGARLLHEQLLACDDNLQQAAARWLETGEETPLEAGGYSASELQERYKMNYPAAVLTLDWLRKEPQQALTALKEGIK